MFIQNLQIDRFGSVANLALDNLTQGVTVIQGGPGTGKTTLLQFARAILYGFDDSTRSQYLPAISSNEFGGSITWASGNHQYTICRHDDGKFNGQFEALDDGRPSSRATLTGTLQGVSADLYSRLFAVDFSRRPDVSGLLGEAAHCGFRIEGRSTDNVKLQELQRRLATLQETLATFGPVDQSADALQLRRRELLDDIARLEMDATRCHDEPTQTQSQIDAMQRQQDTARQELQALRKALDQVTTSLQDGRSRLAKAEAATANSRSHETDIRGLDTQIERWQSVLREAAVRYEALGKREHAAENIRLGNQTNWTTQTMLAANCDCQRKQLARAQAELQVSLRYLEDERDALLADCRPSRYLTNEIIQLKQQLDHLAAKEAELQQRFDTVTISMRQKDVELPGLLQRLHGLTDDLAERLARNREKLHHVEYLLSEIERRQTLLESIAETQRQVRLAEDGSGESSILRDATNHLRRISGDDFQRIEVTQGKHVWVADAKGHRLSWGHLSESVRDQVYLSLCLALVEAHDQRNAPLPLIWKDVFTNFDSRQLPEAAELLYDFARDGRQILLLTRHEHVAGVFRLMTVPNRKLVATHNWYATGSPGDDREAMHDVNRLLMDAGDEESTEVDPAWVPRDESETEEEFHLFDDSPIEQSPSLSSENAVRLRRLGILTVGDLLEASTNDIASDLGYAGISTSIVADWQAQALMMCSVARLREYDARILVACGIRDPHQLQQIPPVEVRSMIERFAKSPEGRAMLMSGTDFELSRVTNWVRTEEAEDDRRPHDSRDAEGTRSRESSRSNSGHRAPSSRSSRESSRGSSNRSARRSGGQSTPRFGNGGSRRTTSGESRGDRSSGASDRRIDGRDRQGEQQQADIVKMTSASESESNDLQFYLESDAGVVDAPSIGPRGAERLEKVGVVTVSDFLAAEPDALAGRLKNKRMSSKVIGQWQRQTELVCRVPRLRGHDAQILVAVGVTDVEKLASMDPQDLWALVEPFSKSSAGQRIIRNSSPPDFEEVFHWIEWAGQARALKAA